MIHTENMSTDINFPCTLCGKVLTTKSNLTKHIQGVHRRSSETSHEMDMEPLSCSSRYCPYTSMYAADMRRHVQKCILVKTEHKMSEDFDRQITDLRQQIMHDEFEVTQIRSKCKEDIMRVQVDKDKEITRLQAENDILRQELEKAQGVAQSLAKEAINRPTTIANTTNNNQQNIGNVKITNYLAGNDVFTAQTHPEHVKNVLDKHFEAYFMDGQQGLVEHVIKVEGKLILVCTDTSRKRFRFVNTDGKLAEDMKAKI